MSYNSALLVFMFVINIIQHPVNAYRVFERDSGVTILALENETVNIQCQTNMPMAYCGFIHPSGVRYSFTGQGLKDGQCALKRKVSTNDSGEWKCHIGKESTGVELQQTILLRVVSHLAAIRPNLTAVHGKSVALECATTKRMTPLQYCRFEPPMGTPFSISPAITAESPILGRFYYPLNKSLDRGDCVMTIRKVKYEDVGLWTCGAGLDDGKEHIDIISLQVDGKAKFVPETEDIENKADCSPPLKRSNIESNKKSSILFDSEIAIATQSQVCSENDTTTKAKDQHYEADSDCTYFEQDSQSIEDYLALGNRPKYTEDEEVFAGSAKQDIATQTLNDANESVGVQTINFANNEYENIKDANYHFGMFVGLYTMSTASATGITFGAIGIAAFLAVLGIVVWKKRRFLGTGPPEEPEIIEIQELGPLPRSPRTTPRVTPRASPQMARHVPSVVIQSPSTQGTPSSTIHQVM